MNAQTSFAAVRTAPEPSVLLDVPYGADPMHVMDIYPTAEPSPVVVVVHGGRWIARDKADIHVQATAERIAEEDFAVFNINYRLATDERPGYPMMTDDVAAAVDWIRAHASEYGGRPADINLVGGSSGAQLTARASQLINAATPGTIRRQVLLSGPMDFVRIVRPANGEPPPDGLRVGVETYLGCSPSACTDAQLTEPSPLYNIDGATGAPTLLVNSDREMIPLDHATDMHAALLAAGGVSSLIVLPGDGHAFAVFDQVADAVLRFLGQPIQAPALTGDPPAGTRGVPYRWQLGVAGNPAPELTALAVPPGLTLAADGLLTGTPTTVGTFRLTVRADNSLGSSELAAPLVVRQPPPRPTARSATPALGIGAMNRPVTVTGTGFTPDTVVTFSGRGVAAATRFRSATTLEAVVSVYRVATAMTYDVVVSDPQAGSSTCRGCFTVLPGPQVTSITPEMARAGSAVAVTVSGAEFGRGATLGGPPGVRFEDVLVVDSATIRAMMVVAAGRSAGTNLTVSVTNPAQQGFGVGTFSGLTVTA